MKSTIKLRNKRLVKRGGERKSWSTWLNFLKKNPAINTGNGNGNANEVYFTDNSNSMNNENGFVKVGNEWSIGLYRDPRTKNKALLKLLEKVKHDKATKKNLRDLMIKYNYELLTTPKSKSRSKKTQSTPTVTNKKSKPKSKKVKSTPIKKSKSKSKSKSRKSSIKNNFPFSNNNNKSTQM